MWCWDLWVKDQVEWILGMKKNVYFIILKTNFLKKKSLSLSLYCKNSSFLF